MNILLTGGTGYIGSHTIIELINNHHNVIVVDNLMNSSQESLRRVEKITGSEVPFYNIDLCDKEGLSSLFKKEGIDAVIHFAGLKSVGESVAQPLMYYRNNLLSTINLCEVMSEHGVKKIIFSSSATVYGAPSELPLKETSTVGVGLTNPYGQTKYMIECILHDLFASDSDWNITILRYFNPVGAHESGTIGEDPNGIPNNLMPFVSQVAVGKRASVNIFGNDYETPDGTGVRDYIHVVDLARGHVAALENLSKGIDTYNLGTGVGVSVLDIIHSFEKASGRTLPYTIAPRREGDIASCFADCSKAEDKLHWRATLTIDDACQDAWRWQSQNPNGYKSSV